MGEGADGSRGPIHFLSTMLLVLSQAVQAAKIKSHELRAYNQHTFISHSSGTLKSVRQHGLVLDGEGSTSGLQTAGSSLCPHMAEGALWDPFTRALIPLCPQDLSTFQGSHFLPSTITLSIRISVYEIGEGDTNIQTTERLCDCL